MGPAQAQAQAQAQRVEAIAPGQSLELVRALLRVSIYHVTYLRGIFPDEHYKSVDMRNLDNMEIQMLLPADPESERLVQWVEGGVSHALERRYLRKLFFGFSKDAAGKELLEEYVFSFSYDQDGSVHMAAGGSSHGGKEFSTKQAAKPKPGPTLSAVKYQVCRLMRMLVELTNTLEQVPEERYLFMKLTYTDDTPDEYEPPMFAPAIDGGVGCFSRMPFVMEVGKVDTRHIKVGLAVKTVLDNVEEDEWGADGVHLPVADDNSNLFCPTERPATTGASAPSEAPASSGKAQAAAGSSGASAGTAPSRRDTAEDASMGGGYSCAAPKAAAATGEIVQRPDSATKRGGRLSAGEEAELEVVKQWILGRPQGKVHVMDALARFSAIPTASLDACFDTLRRQGVLVPTSDPDSYILANPAKPAAQPQPKPAAPAAPSPSAAMQALRIAPMDSQQGGVHEAPGSQRTMSVAGKRKAVTGEEVGQPDEEEEMMVFPETQPSMVGGPAVQRQQRKASMVREPIEQGSKRRRKAPAAVAATPMAEAAAAVPQQQPGGAVRRSTRHR